MKRSWVGFGMLVVLLAAALALSWAMEEIHAPVARDLKLAADHALSGQWEGALTLAEQAEGMWTDWAGFRSCFADHGPMEEVESGFARLGAYGASEDAGEFAAVCRDLARKVEAMGQAHGLTWRALL